MVREFSLINEKGQKFSLMNIHTQALLTDPSGLGYGYSTSYEQAGYRFIENLRTLDQIPISGDLNFLNYDNYNDFINFIEDSEQLRFVYRVPFKNRPIVDFYRDINIQSISKTQIQPNGVITEPVMFDVKSLWYEENETIFKIEPKEREIRWNFTWASRFISYNTRNILFNNLGHTESPFLVEIDGKVVSPTISIYNNQDELISQLRVQVTIEEYEQLIFSTLGANNTYLVKRETDGTYTNLFDFPYIDPNNNNIFRLPKGTSEIRLTALDDVLNAKVTIYPQYKVV